MGLVGKAHKGFGLTLALWQWGWGLWCHRARSGITWPHPMEHDVQPHQGDQHQLGEKEIRDHGTTPSCKCRNEGIVPGFQTTGMSRRLEVHIWTRSRCQGALEWTNTLRDRCSHISGLVVKTLPGLRALMKSALPLLITTAASGALSLRRLGGTRADLSCHQFDHTSHCAEGLLDLYQVK